MDDGNGFLVFSITCCYRNISNVYFIEHNTVSKGLLQKLYMRSLNTWHIMKTVNLKYYHLRSSRDTESKK